MKKTIYTALILLLGFQTCFSQKTLTPEDKARFAWWEDARFGILVLVVSLQAIGEKIVTQKTINSVSNMSQSYSLVHSLQRCVRIILTFPEIFKLGMSIS